VGFQPSRKTRTTARKTVRIIRRRITGIVTQIRLIPHAIVSAVRQSKEDSVRAEVEAERLDRIRNPLKYLGK
jgi:hypothetical protein